MYPTESSSPTRSTYVAGNPWTDASGNRWEWDAAKNRWSPVAAGTSLTAGAGIDITDSVISLDMPDALAFGASDPNKARMIIGNISETLLYAGLADRADGFPPKPHWTSNGLTSAENYASSTAFTELFYNNSSGGWEIELNDETASTIGSYISDPTTAPYPDAATGWALSYGPYATPTVTAAPLLASFIGQRCKASSAWWTWNGMGWDADSYTAGTGISITGTTISLDMPDALSGISGPINESGTKATGTITFTGSPSPGERIIIGSTSYYFNPTTSPATETDIFVSPILSLTPVQTRWAQALSARINNWSDGRADPNVTASSSGGVVTLTAIKGGPIGNAIPLSELAANVSITSAMSGGILLFSTSPVATHLGQLYYATSSKTWYRWDGEAWVEDEEYVGALSGSSPPISATRYAQGYPSMVLVGADIIVSGITSPLAANGTYSPTGAAGYAGKPTYQKAGSPPFTITSALYGPSPQLPCWVLSENIASGTMGLVTELFVSGLNSANSTPADATVWASQNTQNDITMSDPVGSYLGQLYNQTATGLWHRWNGTGWDEDGITNLSATAGDLSVTINSDTGTDAVILAANGLNAGLLLPAEKTKLANVADGATANTGTVTSVTATSPVAASAGTDPVISMAAASSIASGYLTSADWATFNNKVTEVVSDNDGRIKVTADTTTPSKIKINLPEDVSGLSSVSAKSFLEGVFSPTASVGGDVDLSGVTESVITATLSGSITTFILPAPSAGKSIILHLKQATTPTTASFTGVIWSGNVPPVITPAAGKVDILSFVAGPNLAGTGYKWYGSFIQNFLPT